MPIKHIEKRGEERKQRENLRYIECSFKRVCTFQPPNSRGSREFQEEEKEHLLSSLLNNILLSFNDLFIFSLGAHSSVL